MTYDLILGDYAYSSWSLRGWLLFEKFGIARNMTMVDFSTKDVADQLAEFFPANTVPPIRTPEGALLSDSLAMAEELATRHPDAGHWPSEPKSRATARNLSAEMHSSFTALRSACPMNVRTSYDHSNPSDEVRADLERLELLWTHARDTCSPSGPWLCGDYGAVDAFFAPVAARIAGFSLPVGPVAQAYVDAHLNDPAFRRWRAMGFAQNYIQPGYDNDLPEGEWTGPKRLPAAATDRTDSQTTACPYSGKPVTDFLEMDGQVWGFCNPFCRDKTAADPEAWPAFMDMVNAH